MRTSNLLVLAAVWLPATFAAAAPARADAASAAAASAASAAAAAQVSVDMMNLDIRNRQERCEREIMRLAAMAPGPVDRDTLVSMAKENGCDLSTPSREQFLVIVLMLLIGFGGMFAYEKWDERRRGFKA